MRPMRPTHRMLHRPTDIRPFGANEGKQMEIGFTVDLRVYSLEALKKAMYALGRVCTAQISLLDDVRANVALNPLPGELDASALEGYFWQEILDQDLRESVGRETSLVRNLIMAHALSKVPLLNPDLESGDPTF